MSFIGTRPDFEVEVLKLAASCSECHRKKGAGQTMLVSKRNGQVKKRVCSEECRQDFEDWYWQEIADDREEGLREKGLL